jgi:plasmid maintenance system antidote protein VapI
MYIGSALKVALAKQDKSQNWLADEMGVVQSYVSHMATNKANVRLQTAYRVARALGMEFADFMALGDELDGLE